MFMDCLLQLCNASVGISIVEFATIPPETSPSVQLFNLNLLSFTSVENLQNLLQTGVRQEAPPPRLEEGSGSGVLPRRADTFGGYDSILSKSESGTIHAGRKSTI